MNVIIFRCSCEFAAVPQIQEVHQMLPTNEQHLAALGHLLPVLLIYLVIFLLFGSVYASSTH